MKCLHIIPTYKPAFVYGGPIYSTSALCEELIRGGHEVTVITTTANGPTELNVKIAEVQLIEGVSVIYFKRYTKDHTHLSPGLFGYLWKNIHKFDTVHIHSWWNLVSLMSVIICAIKGVRPVVSPRGMLSDYTQGANHSISKKLINLLIGRPFLSKVKFHATSHAEALEIIKIYPSAHVATIFNFVNLPEAAEYQLRAGKRDEKVQMLFLSRIDPKKGLDLLFGALKNIHWDYHLTIAGPYQADYRNELINIAKEANIDDNITWLDPIYGAKKYDLLAANDFLVLPSHNENFANIVIESLAVGCPVLISDKVGLAPYITEKDLGWITQTTSTDITNVLNKMNDDTEKQDRIRRHSPTMVRNDFDGENLVRSYLSLYQV